MKNTKHDYISSFLGRILSSRKKRQVNYTTGEPTTLYEALRNRQNADKSLSDKEPSRRDFLKALGGLIIIGTVGSPAFAKPMPAKVHKKANLSSEFDLLWNAFYPTLFQNEGKRLHFYRCSSQNLTVGYGSNVEENMSLLDNIKIYRDGVEISDRERLDFLSTHPQKSTEELATYQISQKDAYAISKKFTQDSIKNLANCFKDKKSGKSIFFDLPIPMQVLALDVYYNVGRGNFSRYRRFKAALMRGDYKTATRESTVYVSPGKTNQERERRKKRLWSILQVIQKNPTLSTQKIQELVARNYQDETPKLIRTLAEQRDKLCEDCIVVGEMKRQQAQKRLCQNRKNVIGGDRT